MQAYEPPTRPIEHRLGYDKSARCNPLPSATVSLRKSIGESRAATGLVSAYLAMSKTLSRESFCFQPVSLLRQTFFSTYYEIVLNNKNNFVFRKCWSSDIHPHSGEANATHALCAMSENKQTVNLLSQGSLPRCYLVLNSNFRLVLRINFRSHFLGHTELSYFDFHY